MMSKRQSDRHWTGLPGARAGVGVFAVVATFVLFLIWDQFGFLRHLEATTDSAGIRTAMAAMGISGLLASLLCGLLLARFSESRLLAAGFVLAAGTVPISHQVHSLPSLALAGSTLGIATGVVTVSLATGLRRWLPGPELAPAVGIGTGMAYLLCNMPWLFEGSATLQAATVSLLSLAAALAVSAVPGRREAGSAERTLPAADHIPVGSSLPHSGSWPFLSLLLAFLALVWLDSAAFAVIQESLALKGATWATPTQKWLQGVSHLLAALAAGVLLRRGHLRGMLLATLALFGAAFQLLQVGGEGAGTALSGPIYAVGISLYSTALVVAPSLFDGTGMRLPKRWRAALLYGIAGWLGSALGVGMAQDLHRIPDLFVAAAGTVLLLGWAAAVPRARVLLRLHALTLLGAVAAVAVFLILPTLQPTGDTPPTLNAIRGSDHETSASRGRAVYIAEGCISCHSQYVRPRLPADQELYGPSRPLDRTANPPLPGLRRQGPDLSNVGSRHGAAWMREHLRDPRIDNPASTMPSYRHLFRAGSRGDDLVAYLESLQTMDSP